MISFEILDQKHFMSLLLKQTTFDDFLLYYAEISATFHITIDGKKEEHFIEECTEQYCTWAEIRHLVFDAIRGKRTPKQFKLILSRPTEEVEQYPNASALYWNILFQEHRLYCTLSISQQTFSLDKTDESQWETWVRDFCHTHKIAIQ